MGTYVQHCHNVIISLSAAVLGSSEYLIRTECGIGCGLTGYHNNTEGLSLVTMGNNKLIHTGFYNVMNTAWYGLSGIQNVC